MPESPFDRNRLRFNKRQKEFPGEKGELYDVFYFGHVGFIQQWPDATDWNISVSAQGRHSSRHGVASLDEAKDVVIELLKEIYG
jgi:hypothetical protein